MINTMPKIKQSSSLKPKGITLKPLRLEDFSGVKDWLGIQSYDDYQQHLVNLQNDWEQGQEMSLLVRKKSNGKILAILQLTPASSGHIRMTVRSHPNYKGTKKLNLAMNTLAHWCLDHGAKRVFTIAR